MRSDVMRRRLVKEADGLEEPGSGLNAEAD
jgi:hypothetical protein